MTRATGDLELSALAAAEGFGALVALADQAVLVEQLLGAAVALGAADVERLEDRLEVLPDGQPAKIAAFLREIADAPPGPLVHGQVGDVGGVEGDRPAVGGDHAQDHAEGGGFARPVAAEQADDLFLGQDEADLIDDGPAVVTFDELGGFEQIHWSGSISM